MRLDCYITPSSGPNWENGEKRDWTVTVRPMEVSRDNSVGGVSEDTGRRVQGETYVEFGDVAHTFDIAGLTYNEAWREARRQTKALELAA